MGDESDESSNSAKRTRGVMQQDSTSFDSIKEFLSKMDKKLDDNNSALCSRFDDFEANISTKIVNVTSEMNKKIESVAENCSGNHSDLFSKIDQLTKTVNALQSNLVDDKERVAKSFDVVIRGVPLCDSENEEILTAVVHKIATAISFVINDNIRKIFRSGNKKSPSSNKSTYPNIIVKFSSVKAKKLFMKCYFAFKILNLSHIGLKSQTRIFCNDNLSKKNYELFNKAIKLKKINIHTVFTIDGFVFIQIKPDERPTKVLDDSQLANLPLLDSAASSEAITRTLRSNDRKQNAGDNRTKKPQQNGKKSKE